MIRKLFLNFERSTVTFQQILFFNPRQPEFNLVAYHQRTIIIQSRTRILFNVWFFTGNIWYMDKLWTYQPDCKLLPSQRPIGCMYVRSIMRNTYSHTNIVIHNKNLLSCFELALQFLYKVCLLPNLKNKAKHSHLFLEMKRTGKVKVFAIGPLDQITLFMKHSAKNP